MSKAPIHAALTISELRAELEQALRRANVWKQAHDDTQVRLQRYRDVLHLLSEYEGFPSDFRAIARDALAGDK